MGLPSAMYLDSSGSDIRAGRLEDQGFYLRGVPSRAVPAQADDPICLCTILANDAIHGDAFYVCPRALDASDLDPATDLRLRHEKKRRIEDNAETCSTLEADVAQSSTESSPVPRAECQRVPIGPQRPVVCDSRPVFVYLSDKHNVEGAEGTSQGAWFSNIGRANAILQLGLWLRGKHEPGVEGGTVNDPCCMMCFLLQAAGDHLRLLSTRMSHMILSSVSTGILSTGNDDG